MQPDTSYRLPLPENLPVINADRHVLDEKHWKRIPVGAKVRSTFQAYILLPEPHWTISAYFTSDGFTNKGFVHYRAPASLSAWLEVLPQLARKYWRRWTRRKEEVVP